MAGEGQMFQELQPDIINMNPYQESYKLREQFVKANEDVMGIHTLQGHETLLFQQCYLSATIACKSYEVSYSHSAALMVREWGKVRWRSALNVRTVA